MRSFLLIAAAAFLGVGCSSGYKFSAAQFERPSAWPYYHGSVEATGAVPAGTFSGKLDVIWEKGEPGKSSGPLTLHHGVLAWPSAKRRIKFFDAETGEYAGKLKGKAASPSGLVLADSVGCFAVEPSRNYLACFDLSRGKELWKRPLSDASRGSILVGNRLLIGSASGQLTAFDLDDGSKVWSFSAEDRFEAPPAFGHGIVFQPGGGGVLYAVSPDDGAELYRVELDGPLVSAVAVSDLVIAADMLGHVYGIVPADGSIAWRVKVGGPVWTSPAVSDGRAFIGHSGGELVALDVSDGHILWRFQAVEVVRASAIVVGSWVVAGTMGGQVFCLRAADGQVVDKRRLEGGITEAPVSDGDRVYVATESGRIVCLGDRNEQPQQARNGSNP